MQSDQGLHCSLTYSLDTVENIDEQRSLRSEYADTHSDVDLTFRICLKGSFRTLRIIISMINFFMEPCMKAMRLRGIRESPKIPHVHVIR